MGLEKNLFEKESLRTIGLSQNINPAIIINPMPGNTEVENKVLNRYQWAIKQVGNEIKYLINDGIKNGRIPPYKSFTFNLKVGNLPYKLKGFQKNERGGIRPIFDNIDMEWITEGSSPNEYNIIFSSQSLWFPPEMYMACATHAIGGHGSHGVYGNEKEIEKDVMGVLEKSGKKHITDYMRRNSGYIV